MPRNRKQMLVGAVLLAATCWWLATAPESPFRPAPLKPDRPVLAFLAKVARVAARVGLTTLFFFEPNPNADEVPMVHAAIGADGHQLLDNSRW